MISRKCDAEMLHSSRKVNFHIPQSLVHAIAEFLIRNAPEDNKNVHTLHTSVNHRSNQKDTKFETVTLLVALVFSFRVILKLLRETHLSSF